MEEKSTQIKEGDLVLIGNDSSKRINWPIDKIEAIYHAMTSGYE